MGFYNAGGIRKNEFEKGVCTVYNYHKRWRNDQKEEQRFQKELVFQCVRYPEGIRLATIQYGKLGCVDLTDVYSRHWTR